MLSFLMGLVTVGLSLWGMVRWWPDVLTVLRGLIPVCFLMGGVVAVIAGLSTFGGKKEDAQPAPGASADKK